MLTPIEIAAKNGSFNQTNKYETKSDKFIPVQPESLRQVMENHGLTLASIKVGSARRLDRTNFQTTIARYRHENNTKINGLNLDIVIKVPHLYGAIELFLGTYIQVCSNGLVVGDKFRSFKVRHQNSMIKGSVTDQLNKYIPILLNQYDAMTDTIKRFESITLNKAQIDHFARTIATKRLENTNNDKVVTVDWNSLLNVKHVEQSSPTLWNTLNVIQENAIRYGFSYTTKDDKNNIRYMRTRKLNDNTSQAIELNRYIWNIAEGMAV